MGFQCPKCGHRWAMERNCGRKWVCGRRGCSYWESPTTGTIAECLKKPLRLWFWGLWLFARSPGGITASRLQEELGLGSYQTAWTWCQKYRVALSRDPGLFTQPKDTPAILELEGTRLTKGIHGWSGGGKGLALALVHSEEKMDQARSFWAWLQSLNACRVSSKHHWSYWAEYVFWNSFKTPKRRWQGMHLRLAGPLVPYWQLIGRVDRTTRLAPGDRDVCSRKNEPAVRGKP